jgi:predicted nucleic acid-binding protein
MGAVTGAVLIDTGPLVALFNVGDRHHKGAVGFIRDTKARLITTSAVLVETGYLLDFSVEAQADFFSWIAEGAVDIIDPKQDDYHVVASLLRKYADVPMDVADATLVFIAGHLRCPYIATYDGDFQIYRYAGKSSFKLVLKS